MKKILTAILVSFMVVPCQAQDSIKDIATFTSGMQEYRGFFNFYWDNNTGKIYLEVDRLNEEFLYVVSLPAGIGSNDLGLDRGQLGGSQVVKFQRSGPKIMLVQLNYQYRAISDNTAEKTSVEQAFAQSIIGGFTVLAQQGNSVLIDATDFLLRDAHGYTLGTEHSIVRRLKSAGQGTYAIDPQRSAVYLERTRNFPQNSEFEATLTFALKEGEPYGEMVGSVVPSPESITVRLHHSFVKLPDSNYQMRESDPRCGYHGISFHDYATPIDQPLIKHYIHRHRLEKKDPTAEISQAIEPIVYYVDYGAPEPIRSALVEGASWWNQAFEAAGYENAFQVKILPEDVDPMDVSYNVIQWVHRSTRGWSYGTTVADPRTGEIIKGHVTLGSLRVRQDFTIAQGLVAAYKNGNHPDPRLEEMALARLRQLSAHEVGHTLGLLHNYAASSNQRASVMDYPHPFIQLQGDNLDFSQAYDDKIGLWDKQAIKYGYQDLPQGIDEDQALERILQETIDLGLRYITDRDARPLGGAHPYAHLWDNGADPVTEMKRLLSVRKKALQEFGENTIPMGVSWSGLEEVLVPLYLSHRYQIEAVGKLVGGLDYTYSVKGDGQDTPKVVDRNLQFMALQAMLSTLDPEVLAIPEHIRNLIPPKVPNHQRGRESFKSRMGVVFDPMAAAEGLADASISILLDPNRASRLAQQVVMDSDQLGLAEVLDRLIDQTWKNLSDNHYYQEIHRLTGQLFLRRLMDLALNPETSIQARAISHAKIMELQQWIEQQTGSDRVQQAYMEFALTQINLYKTRPEALDPLPTFTMPDGSPIGMQTTCIY